MPIIEKYHNINNSARRESLSANQELTRNRETGIRRKLKYGNRTQFAVSLNV